MRTILIATLAITAQGLAAQSNLKVELVQPGVFSTGAGELPPTFSPDGKQAYWSVSTPTYARWIVILQSQLVGGKWQRPAVAPFSGQWIDADPFFTEDGKRLYFLSRRPLTSAEPERGYRIWYVDREANGWSPPVALPAHVNDSDMHYVAPVRSGSVYIAGIRNDSNNQGDLYRVPFVNGAWAAPVNLGPVVNAPTIHDTTPYVAPDESYIIYASTRPGGVGGLDLFITFREGDGWSTPRLLPEPINSRVRDFCPIASPDGQWLYFSSDRGFADTPLTGRVDYAAVQRLLNAPGNSAGDIYRTSLPELLRWARSSAN
jgi:WD40 repeat protein